MKDIMHAQQPGLSTKEEEFPLLRNPSHPIANYSIGNGVLSFSSSSPLAANGFIITNKDNEKKYQQVSDMQSRESGEKLMRRKRSREEDDDESHNDEEKQQLHPYQYQDQVDTLRSRRKKCRSDKDTSPLHQLVWDELTHLIRLSLPIIGTYLLEFLPGIVSIMLVGHVRVHEEFGEEFNNDEKSITEMYIDATALALVLVSLTGLSIGFGLSTALDTLCSQAYGASQTHRMGTYLQTGLIVMFIIFCFIVLPAMLYADRILIALQQPVLVSQMAGVFARYMIPGIPFLLVYELLRKVFQAQNVALPMAYVSIVANVVNITIGYYLVYYTSWGWLGAAIARTLSNISFLLALMPFLYVNINDDDDKGKKQFLTTFWTGWHIQEACEGLEEFISLGLPGMLQLCFEWWAFELIAVFSGMLPNSVIAIGTNSIVFNIGTMSFMFYLGNSIAGNVRIGNALGGREPKRAKVAAYLTIALAMLNSLFCATLLLVFNKQLPKLFTHDEVLGQSTSKVLYVVAAFQIADGVNGAVQGIFRGSGRQAIGAKLIFVAYYVLGIPLGLLLAFKYGMEVLGLWLGMTAGLYLVATLGAFLAITGDWDALADEAIKRSSS